MTALLRGLLVYGFGIMTGGSLMSGLQALRLQHWSLFCVEGAAVIISALAALLLVWRDTAATD